MDLQLEGKVAVVAAASKGLGYGVARALAHEGAHVCLSSRDQATITAAAERLRAETAGSGAQITPTACDVTQPDQLEAWIAGAAAQHGRIDALLVNAGGPPAGKFTDFTDAQWQTAFDQMIMLAVRMIRLTIPHMTDGGAILTVTSTSWIEPIPGLILSTVMRAGVSAMVKILADELAPRNIRVNNLLPGRIDTDRVAHLDSITAERTGKSIDEVRADSAARIPLRRLGTIDEFGAAGAFLLSPAASYITGAVLRVDGGQMRSV
jgi:3-oxoacyl-[acyl-carrier protein] reductase